MRRNPVEPDPSSRTLLGPGVTELTIENPIRPRSVPTADRRRPAAGSCTIPAVVVRRSGRVGRGSPRSRVSARPSASFATTPTRPISTMSGRSSSSTQGRSGTTSTGTSAPPSRRWSPSSRRTSSTTAARRRRRLPEAGRLPRAERLGETLTGPAVDRPMDRRRATSERGLPAPRRAGCADDALEAETRLAFVALRIQQALRRDEPPGTPEPDHATAARLRDVLDAHAFEPITLADAALAVGAGATHAAHSFVDAFGIAPHALRAGSPPRGRPRANPRRPAVS